MGTVAIDPASLALAWAGVCGVATAATALIAAAAWWRK